MKKRVRMKCIFKTGNCIKDSLLVSKDELQVVNKLKTEIENSLAKEAGDPKRMVLFTFAHTTVLLDEIAAIKIW